MPSFNLDSLTISPRTLGAGDFGVIFRNGNVAAISGTAITTTDDAIVRNSGAISSITDSAIAASGAGLVIENTGSITGGTTAISLTASISNVALRLVSSGTINASSDGHAAIQIQGHGAMIVNTGEIISLGGHGISFSEQIWVNLTNNIFNSGTIYARGNGDIAIRGSGAVDNIENSGLISGDVVTGNAADVVTNSGMITGRIDLGGGNDSFIGRTGEAIGIVDGGDGDDKLRSGGSGEEMYGGGGNDTVRGGGGDDTLSGDAGSDSLFGGAGDDTVLGGAGFDTLSGGNGDDSIDAGEWGDLVRAGGGDDTLLGGQGFDTMRGGKGEDSLVGGEGRDSLLGGPGADTLVGGTEGDWFVFEPGGDADRVTDFQDGQDIVDLRAFGLKNFNDLSASYTIESSNLGVRIDFGGGDLLVLDGIQMSGLGGSDFLF